MNKYKHEEDVHNLKSPDLIVPKIIELLKPESVVDFGCGLGTFLNAFKRHGIKDVLGIDGAWTNKELLYKYITSEEFLEWDLEKEIRLNKKFDLAVSLEVAEHLSAASADSLVKSLVNCGKVILFSAATPNQGGQNHINEQMLTYWEEKFLIYDFIIYDVLRPIFWNVEDIFWWYKQNMVIVAPKGLKFHIDVEYLPIRNIIHYELLNQKSNQLDKASNRIDKITKQFKNETYKSDNLTKQLDNETYKSENLTKQLDNETYKSDNLTKQLDKIHKGKETRIRYLKWFIKSIVGQNNLDSFKRILKK